VRDVEVHRQQVVRHVCVDRPAVARVAWKAGR
jgi:hypothetical protein